MTETILGIALGAVMVGCATEESPEGPIETAEVVEDVEYYHACGNETLHLQDGRVFYPLLPEEQDDFDESPYSSSARPGPAGPLIAVAPPGPGDDAGTLTIYDDGMAYWESESGITAWLSDEEREYNWDC
ncbi:hypothetical protein [Nesterenkonia populi]